LFSSDFNVKEKLSNIIKLVLNILCVTKFETPPVIDMSNVSVL